jgi:hypothetical protein
VSAGWGSGVIADAASVGFSVGLEITGMAQGPAPALNLGTSALPDALSMLELTDGAAHPPTPTCTQAENYDYKLVGPKTWAKLQEWYGGGPAFPRKVIMRGVQESVELFPQPCKVQLAGDDGQPSGEPTTILVPRGTAAPGVLDLCCEQLSKDAVAARLWIKVGMGVDVKGVGVRVSPMPLV